MLDILCPENLENVVANILNSEMQDFPHFHALAQQVGPCMTACFFQYLSMPGRERSNVLLALQIVFKAMQSPEAAEAWSQSLVALDSAKIEPGACSDGVTEPLGFSSGPGKAFRSGHLFRCVVQHTLCLALACGLFLHSLYHTASMIPCSHPKCVLCLDGRDCSW